MQPKENKKISPVILALNFSIIIFLIILVYLVRGVLYAPSNPKNLPAQVISAPAFANVLVTSQAALVFDISKNKIIFEKNEFAQLPFGSISAVVSQFASSTESAKSFGMNETYFVNKNIASGSAEDLSLFVRNVFKQNSANLEKINIDSGDGNVLKVFNPSIGRPIVIVILGSYSGSTKDDLQKLITASLAYIGQ